MKLHILNDLHIEFADFDPPVTDADVVILAGDIGVGRQGVDWAGLRFPDRPVIYVAGNHEFYHHDLALVDALKSQAPDHVRVLNDDQCVIDGVRFLGCILWTDFALFGEADRSFAMQAARQRMNDYLLIHNQDRPFTPEDAARMHAVSRDWLAARLAEPFAGKTVVVTHHAPSSRSVPGRYAGHPLAPAFASDLEALMDGQRISLWVHGHVHEVYDYTIRGTRVVCNPRGYAPEKLTPGFRPDRVVTV
jgi:predicted phosphodiesterase